VLNVLAGGVLTNLTALSLGGVSNTFNLAGDATLGSLALSGANAQVNVNGGTLRASAGGNFITGTGSVFVAAGGLVLDSQAFNVTVSNALLDAGGGRLTKLGAGTASLLGASTYGGGTTVSNGAVAAGNNRALGDGS